MLLGVVFAVRGVEMPKFISVVLGAVASLLALSLLAGCSSTPSDVDVSTDAVIIDVRTPSEFAAGHLPDAQLIDFNAGELEAAIAELDPEGEYFVYCRSGNRSGQAVAIMEDAGFTNVTDLGSIENAAKATGLEITR